jgi:hypothetical protein
MIIESDTKDLIIVFEDKGRWKLDGYLGQIVSEILMCHYHNRFISETDNAPDEVFLLRCFQYYVSAFSMKVDENALSELCDKGVLKSGEKLKLISDLPDPMKKGYSLLIKKDRKAIVLLIESIRLHCIARKKQSKK